MRRLLPTLAVALISLAACQPADEPPAVDAPALEEAATPSEAPEPAPDAAPTPTAAPQPDSHSEAPGEQAVGVIRGELWSDVCEGGGTSGSQAGCVERGADLVANGTREANESALDGVEVALAAGACPGEGIERATTGSAGSFEFTGLAAGTYCVSVDPGSAANQALLQDGRWTGEETSTGSVAVELVGEGAEAEVLFGWEFLTPAVMVQKDCTDRASFYADVTIPDGTLFPGGESFTKTWKLRNVGTCTWDNGYGIVFGRGEQMGAEGLIALTQSIAPGGIVDVSADLTAPTAPGKHVGHWQLQDAEGLRFGVGNNGTDFFWVSIQVSWPSPSGDADAAEPPAAAASAPAPAPSGSAPCPTEFDEGFEAQVVALINSERTSRGLGPLGAAGAAGAAARGHSVDMGCNGLTGHIGSDGSDWYERIARQGHPFGTAYENVYFGSPSFGGDPAGAVRWWMNSQVHRDNILNESVTEIGAGYAYNVASEFGYYTVVFTRP